MLKKEKKSFGNGKPKHIITSKMFIGTFIATFAVH